MSRHPDRPDWVRCVQTDVGTHHARYGQSWCGRDGLYEFREVSLEEALYTPELGGKLLAGLGEAQPIVLRKIAKDEFSFQSASHALWNAWSGDMLQVCPECSAAMIEALAAGTWHKDEVV